MASLQQYGERAEDTYVVGDDSIILQRVKRPDQALLVSKQCDLWAFVWSSSAVAAGLAVHVQKFMSDHGFGLDVVEIGCGSGLCSVAAAKCTAGQTRPTSPEHPIVPPGHVLATDLVPAALELVAENARLNGVPEGVLHTHKLDWSNETDIQGVLSLLSEMQGKDPGQEDGRPAVPRPLLVMAADVLFSSWTVKPVLQLLNRLLSARPCSLAVIVDPGRPPRDDVEGLAPDLGLRVLARHDVERLVTAVALMRECTVFGVMREGQGEGNNEGQRSLLSALSSAVEAVAGPHARLTEEQVKAGGTKFAYCLPPVTGT